MAENTAYFESVTAAQSMKIKDPFDTEHATISMETQVELAKLTVSDSIRDDFTTVLPYLRMLNVEDRELGKAYFLLGKPQWALAQIYKSTQTQCSFKIRMAMKKLGVLMTYKDHPKVKHLDGVLRDHGVNNLTPIRTSILVVEYRKRRSFAAVSDHFNLHRPEVRRALNKAASTLMADEHEEHVAIGAYIHGLIDKASIAGSGLSEKKQTKHVHLHRVNAPCVGEFIVRVDDPDFGSTLVSKAAAC